MGYQWADFIRSIDREKIILFFLFEVRAGGEIWDNSVLGTNGRVAAEKGAAAQAEPAAIPAIVGAAVVEPAVNAVGAGVHCIFLAKSVILLFFPL